MRVDIVFRVKKIVLKSSVASRNRERPFLPLVMDSSTRKFRNDVFISHAWNDDSFPVSKEVKELLENEDLKVWYDERDMAGDLLEVNVGWRTVLAVEYR